MVIAMTNTAPATHALDGDEVPRWRVEHATSGTATCNQAQCKSKGTKIEKGELRIGTYTYHTMEDKYYWAWRHWRCATTHQLRGLITTSDGEVAKVPGYERISDEGREQLKLALEEGKVADKGFKDVRPDLVQSGGYMGEIRDAIGYKVDVAPSTRAGCRAIACKQQGTKIAKGELRLGFLRLFDGEHESFVYKHWQCISKHDLSMIQEYAQDDRLTGIDSLPNYYEVVVLESLEKGEIIVPPKLDVPAPAKKSRARKKVVSTDDETDTEDEMYQKKSRKRENKKASVGKASSTGDIAHEDPSPKFKTEDARQNLGSEEKIAEADSQLAKNADDTTTSGQVKRQENLRKRKKNHVKNGGLSHEETGGELSIQGQVAKKRKVIISEHNSPAETQAQEQGTEMTHVLEHDTAGGTRTLPVRRSARQAARTESTTTGHVEQASPSQSKHSKKNQAAKVNKIVADQNTEIAPMGKKHKAAAAKKATKKNRKTKAMQTAAQKHPGGKAATSAATKARDTPDENVSMANIAELREFMQANAITTRARRY